MDERVVIWGAGAMGGTIGAHLVSAGHSVVFVDAQPDHVRALCERGFRITGPVTELHVSADALLPHQAGEAAPLTTVLLCVKSQDTLRAARQVAPHLAEDGVVVSVQNGLNEPVIASVVGARRTFGCFVNFGADYMEPGVIEYGGRGAVVVGEMDGAETERARRIHSLFRDFDPDAILSDNVEGYLWSKLAYASMLFATALSTEGIADCLERPEHRRLYAGLGREVVAVALGVGVIPEPFDGFDPAAFAPDDEMAILRGERSPSAGFGGADPLTPAAVSSLGALVAHNRKSAKTHSGIWRDLAVRKRRTEVDAQLGPVVEQASRLEIPVPLNRRLIDMIHEVEDGSRGQSPENLSELERAAAR